MSQLGCFGVSRPPPLLHVDKQAYKAEGKPGSDAGEDAQGALSSRNLLLPPLLAACRQHVHQRAQLRQQACTTLKNTSCN